jgi:protein dithiol oxidoreductase (disulfide-forming)
MFKRTFLLTALLTAIVLPQAAMAQLRWVEGRHYITLPPSPVYAPPAGKIEVTEVFSYGCIACNQAYRPINKIKAALPKDTVMNYVPASFIPTEAWPMFQQAYLAAKSLGIADATHEMMFVAIWDTDEIPLIDKRANRIRQPLPTIEDAARFYSRHTQVKEAQFLEKARSFEIAQQMKRSDELVKTWKIPSTPSLVVNGRYLINNQEAGSWDAVQEIVLFLVSQERVRLKMPAPKP